MAIYSIDQCANGGRIQSPPSPLWLDRRPAGCSGLVSFGISVKGLRQRWYNKE